MLAKRKLRLIEFAEMKQKQLPYFLVYKPRSYRVWFIIIPWVYLINKIQIFRFLDPVFLKIKWTFKKKLTSKMVPISKEIPGRVLIWDSKWDLIEKSLRKKFKFWKVFKENFYFDYLLFKRPRYISLCSLTNLKYAQHNPFVLHLLILKLSNKVLF